MSVKKRTTWNPGYVLLATIILAAVAGRVTHADFSFGTPANLGPTINTSGGDAACISSDGLELYLDSERPGGYGSGDIWVATRATIEDPWGQPVNLGPLVNTSAMDCSPSTSADGLELYYFSLQGGNGDIWMATRATVSDPWGQPHSLGPAVNSSSIDIGPSISNDGLELFFGSNRSGGSGDGDLWVTTRETAQEPWRQAVNLGTTVNSPYVDNSPSISADGLLLFFESNRPGGFGSFDIWVTRRATRNDSWGPPVNLGPPINTAFTEYIPSISSDGRQFYFTVVDRPGGFGGYDIWQASIIPVVDFNGDGKVDAEDMAILMDSWGKTNSPCDVGPLPWGDGVVDEKDWAVLMESLMTPGLRASVDPSDVILNWSPYPLAEAYDVYLGTSAADVGSADRANPLGVLVSQGQTATSYDPNGPLEYSRTYYWRVDSAIPGPTAAIYKGSVLSFTTRAFAYPISTPIKATASSSSTPVMGPEKTVDGSGLTGDQHSTLSSTMWLSKTTPAPAWIKYEFDKTYKLHELWVWNSNQSMEPVMGYGAKEVLIEVSLDDVTWTAVGGVHEFLQAPGKQGYAHNTTVDLGGVSAKYVKLTINRNWGSATKQAGLSEVRFLHIPTQASEPQPASGSTGVPLDTALQWQPGREAARHEVFFSTDNTAVVNGTALVGTVASSQFDPGPLDLDTTYYWKVNEVNDAAQTPCWEGQVWSFSTSEYLAVDDFERYNDACRRISFTWQGGAPHSGSEDCGIPAYNGNGTGSTVGNSSPPFAEQTIVHLGSQSMPFSYNGLSEATRTFDVAQDWTVDGIKTLVLFFCGGAAHTPGELYVKINGTQVPYNDSANALATRLWTQWDIDLASVAGVDLKAVKTLTIGVSSGLGKLYIDDIRLYPVAPAVP